METVGGTRPPGHPDDRDFIEAIAEHIPSAPADVAEEVPGRADAPEVAGASVSYLPVATRRALGVEEAVDGDRRSDVDEWGRSEHMRSIVRRLYDPMYRYWFRVEWDGLEKIPLDRWGPAHRQPRRRHPGGRARPSCTASRRAGASRLRPGRLLLPDDPGGGHHVVAYRRGPGPPGQRLPDPPRPAAAGAGLSRGDQGHLQDVHRPLPAAAVRPGRLRGDRHAGRRAHHPDRRGRRRGGDAHRVPDVGPGQGPQAALLPGHRQLAPPRTARLRHLLPGQVQAPRARPDHLRRRAGLRSATRGAGSWTRPSASGPRMQDTLHDMLRERRSVWFG